MDDDSPFAALGQRPSPGSLRDIHVNYCPLCHHVWKAPAAATACINCNASGVGGKAYSLVKYRQDTPIT